MNVPFVSSVSKWLVSGRSNFAPYGISPFGLSFRRPDQEADYKDFILRITIVHIRFSLVMGASVIVFFGFFDPFVYTHESLVNVRMVRFLLMFPCSILVFLATFHPRYRTYAQVAGMSGIAVIGISLSLLTHNSNAVILVYIFPALVMAMAYSFFFLGLFFPYAFAVAAFMIAIYSIAIWTVIDMPPAMGISVSVSTTTIFLLFTMAAYQKELISRQLFVSEMREREALARQLQNDSRYLSWLRQLAEFLRHEVRQPVARINSSIEIVQFACKADDQVRLQLASASLGIQHVWNLVERASQATNAEAYVRQSQAQWTDLAHLLADQVEAYRQTTSGIEFRLQSPKAVRVYADPTLINEAIGNLLGNAASFAQEESIVEITLNVDVSQAAIRVSNKGPLIEGDTEMLFGPFASTRSGPSSEHQGLGLYLVRLIAERHGGKAFISNLHDGSGVQATILLPLGA